MLILSANVLKELDFSNILNKCALSVLELNVLFYT